MCGGDFKATVSIGDMIRLVDEVNLVTCVNFDSGAIFLKYCTGNSKSAEM